MLWWWFLPMDFYPFVLRPENDCSAWFLWISISFDFYYSWILLCGRMGISFHFLIIMEYHHADRFTTNRKWFLSCFYFQYCSEFFVSIGIYCAQSKCIQNYLFSSPHSECGGKTNWTNYPCPFSVCPFSYVPGTGLFLTANEMR